MAKKSLLKSITENSVVMRKAEGNVFPRANIAVISNAKLIRARLTMLLSDPYGWSPSTPPFIPVAQIWKSSSHHTWVVDLPCQRATGIISREKKEYKWLDWGIKITYNMDPFLTCALFSNVLPFLWLLRCSLRQILGFRTAIRQILDHRRPTMYMLSSITKGWTCFKSSRQWCSPCI